MDQRFGAWAQLLVLFRMIHDGAEAGAMRLPKRHGVLFDPDRFAFLEGRPSSEVWKVHQRIRPPLVPDGTIYRALEKLLVLDGERISYRALDVEQIGSVYETMMGFRLESATGRSVAIKAQKKQGAPTAVDLEALLGEPAARRDKWLQDHAERKLNETVKKAVAGAATLEDLHAALMPVIDLAATPDLIPQGAMVLQPSEERRRSGSHYTPRALTEPIVRTTLEPIFARLRGVDGRAPRPAQILDLKVCDPAMGSGAFLVEACRQLGGSLVEAWHAHGEMPTIPPDEDEVIFARRLIAKRCLYGVDKNPVAVDLAKVSLWLVTLAKDHALTFVDHAFRHGDSLVGLSRKQIESFHWDPDAPRFQAGFETMQVREHLLKVNQLRRRIREASESISDSELRGLWEEAQLEIRKVRLFGDLVLAAYFESEKPKDREGKRSEYAAAVASGEAERYVDWLEEWRHADQPFAPYHWELEFTEVFEREDPGFDAIVGNPPFLGGSRISSIYGNAYLSCIASPYSHVVGKVDLAAFFFLRAHALVRQGGAYGLIATNTISQGETRAAGLQHICESGGTIYCAQRRFRWPGTAAVVVSVVHVFKGAYTDSRLLDGQSSENINAFLFSRGGNTSPTQLTANRTIGFQGSMILGMGFTFVDSNPEATSVAEMKELIARDPRCADVIFPYIGGAEVNGDPRQTPNRWVINFGDRDLAFARERWPSLVRIVEEKVRPQRSQSNREVYRQRWWQFGERQPALYSQIANLRSVIVVARVAPHCLFALLPNSMVFAESLVVCCLGDWASFATLHSRVHEVWARFNSSSMRDDLRYSVADCLKTFPFPDGWRECALLESAGKAYNEFRTTLMAENNEGLTKTYNHFHDPSERSPGILKLREMHAAVDRAVLDAYGWADISTDCNFLLDYEIDEEDLSAKKKPYRYRWPDEVRDEVLARLLELNAKRAKEEARSGAAATKKGSKKVAENRAPKASGPRDLFS